MGFPKAHRHSRLNCNLSTESRFRIAFNPAFPVKVGNWRTEFLRPGNFHYDAFRRESWRVPFGNLAMTSETYQPADRRPIASRERKFWQRVAAALAALRISPNCISILGMVCGVAAGLLLYFTSLAESSLTQRLLWISAALCIQLRLIANMLDGMVAIIAQKASPLGELYNELPDRVSDVAIILGAGYAAGGLPSLGWIAALVAMLTAYVRAVGNAAGVSNLFLGPMAKPQRMFTLTVAALLMTFLPDRWQPCWGPSHSSLPALGLGLIVAGALVTIFRRLGRIVRDLKGVS